MDTTSARSTADTRGPALDFYPPGLLDNIEVEMENSTVTDVRCGDEQVSTPSIYQTVIFFTLAFITVTFNTVLIVMVLKTKGLRKKTNYILVSMAGADLFVGLISEPIWGLALWVDDKDHKYLTAAKFVVHFSLMSSVSHLLVVTLERTIAVLRPLHYRAWVTCGRVQFTVVCTWLWSLFVAALHPFIWSDYSYYLFITWTALLILVIMAILHCMMLGALKRATHALRGFSSHSTWYYQNQEIKESAAVRNARLRERRKTKLVTIITVVFAICSLPSVVSETMCYLNMITRLINNSVNMLFFLNSFINPIIFAIREPMFRAAVMAMCGCHKPRSNLTSIPASANASRENLSNMRLNTSRSDTSDLTVNQGSTADLYPTNKTKTIQ